MHKSLGMNDDINSSINKMLQDIEIIDCDEVMLSQQYISHLR